MIDKGVTTIVHDGDVFVNMEELLTGLFKVCNKWALLKVGSEQDEAAWRLTGMIDMCKGLEDVHDEWRSKHGLTRG